MTKNFRKFQTKLNTTGTIAQKLINTQLIQCASKIPEDSERGEIH